jgi:hypothetical protein
MGARGIGELTDKGSGMQRGELPRSERLHPDDPRLDLVWRKCAELKIPVNLHIADHPSCWQPLGPNQERTPDFQHFNLYGKDVLSHEELMQRRNRLLEKHPKTTFIFCHLSNQGHNLGELAKALDRYPNMFVDISARDYEIGSAADRGGFCEVSGSRAVWNGHAARAGDVSWLVAAVGNGRRVHSRAYLVALLRSQVARRRAGTALPDEREAAVELAIDQQPGVLERKRCAITQK